MLFSAKKYILGKKTAKIPFLTILKKRGTYNVALDVARRLFCGLCQALGTWLL